jgi:hypothetical protein
VSRLDRALILAFLMAIAVVIVWQGMAIRHDIFDCMGPQL